jgi:hypothetical protein
MIRSETRTIAEALRLGSFEPATVQREFQWTTTQTGQLLADLLSAFRRAGVDPGPRREEAAADPADAQDDGAAAGERPLEGVRIARARSSRTRLNPPDFYFLGGVVLFQRPHAKDRYYIYDGFQRFTSLALLLAVLRDTWETAESAEIAPVMALLMHDGVPRLRARTNAGSLATILGRERGERLVLRTAGSTDGDRRMREARAYFEEQVSSWTDARRRAFVEFLSSKVMLSVTEVTNRSLAYQIFVSANARGLRLEIGDILKGQFVECVSQRRPGNASETVAAQFREVQRRLRPKFDEFLHAVEILKCRPEDSSAPGELLIEMFGEETDADTVIDWVSNELKELADIFLATRNHFWHAEVRGVDVPFRQLSFLEWKDWQPVALAMGLAARDDQRTWFRFVHGLQRASYIMELADWGQQKRQEVFNTAIEQLANGHDPFRYRVGGAYGALSFSRSLKEKVRRVLAGPLIDEERRGAITRWLETLQWGTSLPRSCTDDASVEHILPQSPQGSWLEAFSPEQHEYWIDRIGNLCIIPKKMNDEIGNSDWPIKLAAYESLGGRFKGAEDVAANGGWTVDTLKARTEKLARLAVRALRIDQ